MSDTNATKGRIYLVRDSTNPEDPGRLVRASSKAQAVRFVAVGKFTAEVASQEDIVTLIGRGLAVVEDAGESAVNEDADAGVGTPPITTPIIPPAPAPPPGWPPGGQTPNA